MLRRIPASKDVPHPIPCFFLQYADADLLIIFSHGNGCDIGSMYETMSHYRNYWKAHVLIYECEC